MPGILKQFRQLCEDASAIRKLLEEARIKDRLRLLGKYAEISAKSSKWIQAQHSLDTKPKVPMSFLWDLLECERDSLSLGFSRLRSVEMARLLNSREEEILAEYSVRSTVPASKSAYQLEPSATQERSLSQE